MTGEDVSGEIDGGSDGGSDKVNGATGGNVGGAGGIVSGAEVSSVRIRHGNEMMKIGLRKSDAQLPYLSPPQKQISSHLRPS